MRILGIRSILPLVLVALACAKMPAPSVPATELAEPPPASEPEEPPLLVLEKDILEQYRVRVAQVLAQESDDKEFADRIKILNHLIEEMQREFAGLESRKDELEAQEQDRYRALASLLAKQRKKREEEIEASYRKHVVEFKKLNLFLIPPDAQQALQEMRGEIEEVCKSRRNLIILGFGCSKGPVEATERISGLRAQSVGDWLLANASCQRSDIFIQGLGVELPEADITAIDPLDLEPLLEASRHALLLMPK